MVCYHVVHALKPMTKSPVKQKYRSLRRNEITGKTKVSKSKAKRRTAYSKHSKSKEQLTVNTGYNPKF